MSTEAETDQAADDATTGDPSGATPVGVKLGSTRTVIALPGGGDQRRTVRLLTCLATYEDPLSGEEKVIFGDDAATEYPDRVEFMLRSGLPEDDDRAELTAEFYRSVVDAHDVPEDSAVVYAIPTIDNPDGLANLRSVVEDGPVGSAVVESFPESLCGAIPAFGDGLEAVEEVFVSVNMGSTNLEVSAYRRGEQLSPYATGAVTGNGVDRDIATNVEAETQGRVNVDITTAREYKERHADFDDYEPFTDVIQQPGGGTHEFTVESAVMDAVDDYLDDAVHEFANTFLPQLATDHMKIYRLALDRPVVLTGGMACIPGVVEAFENRAAEAIQQDVEAVAPDRPDLAAAHGAQRIAERLGDSG